MAQVFNHLIMPLADTRDRITQIRWGIADFRARFRRMPEGMWVPETAVESNRSICSPSTASDSCCWRLTSALASVPSPGPPG